MVATGETGGLRPPFPSDEDERRGTPGGVEKSLEEVLLLPFHLETIPLEIFADADQSGRLFSFSGDAAPVYKKEDPRGKAKVPLILTAIQTLDSRF